MSRRGFLGGLIGAAAGKWIAARLPSAPWTQQFRWAEPDYTVITKAALDQLRNDLVFNRHHIDYFVSNVSDLKIGDTIRVRKPPKYQVQ